MKKRKLTNKEVSVLVKDINGPLNYLRGLLGLPKQTITFNDKFDNYDKNGRLQFFIYENNEIYFKDNVTKDFGPVGYCPYIKY